MLYTDLNALAELIVNPLASGQIENPRNCHAIHIPNGLLLGHRPMFSNTVPSQVICTELRLLGQDHFLCVLFLNPNASVRA